jgi:uncharacterized membrane protein YoaK (UPF0700 family)
MTDVTGDERADRIIRSLKENSAELARELRAARNTRVRQIVVMCLIFVTGVAVGALLVTAL